MRILIIINTGQSKCKMVELFKAISYYFGNDDICVEETVSYLQARNIAKKAVIDGYDSIIAVGGDGTVNAVINEIYGTGISLGIIPTGTANDIAQYHKIPTGTSEALNVIKNGYTKTIDLIKVNNNYYASSGGIGFSAEVADLKNRICFGKGVIKKFYRSFGSFIYIVVFLLYLFKKLDKTNTVNLNYNHNNISTRFFAVMVNNQDFLGKYFKIAPGAKNDDNNADIVLIKMLKNRGRIIKLLSNVIRGTHNSMNNVSMWKSNTLILKTNKIVKYFGDGEILCEDNYFEIEVLPSALQIFVPLAQEHFNFLDNSKYHQMEMSHDE